VELVDGKKPRLFTAAVVLALVVTGALSSVAVGASKYTLRFVDPPGALTGQPQDAKAGETIRTDDLNASAGFVQIEVVDAAGTRVTTVKSPVGFRLRTGTGFATGSLSVVPQPLVNGVATFGLGTLRINTENEPQFTDYSLIPVTTKGALITGPPSTGFDVWEDGEACDGGAAGGLDDACVATLRGGEDTYTFGGSGSLGVSQLQGVLPGLICDGQKTVFASSVFSYATTGSNTPVRLVNHITKADWQASANNGQAHADWCIGLPTNGPWQNNGADSTQMDTDLDGDLDLWVALAPRCPSANPSGSAPCIVSQTGDGAGGSTSIGWLPPGDPPRRT
jgi:hypothetical protein